MAFAEDTKAIALTGTTFVDAVSAPASGKRLVRTLKIVNRDTVTHDITIRHVIGGTNYDQTIEDVATGEWIECSQEDLFILDSADTDKLQVKSDATATTTEPFSYAAYGDVT
jgi:hypothetical protein